MSERKKAAARKSTGKTRPRLTQPQRRDAMRQRILDATLYCLAHYGYAGTGVAQVVARARISRGAWSHHFPSMNALIVEAADHLLNQVYDRLGKAMLKVAKNQDRLGAMVDIVWQEFFVSDVNEVYLELVIASRRNRELADRLRTLAQRLESNVGGTTGMYFQQTPGGSASVQEMLHFIRWVMRGIALDAQLMREGGVEQALAGLRRVAASQIKQR